MSSPAKKDRVRSNPKRVGFLLYRVGLKITAAYEQRIHPLGFSAVEVGTLTHLASGGLAHVRGLARALGVSPQTIVNVTIGLEARRLVLRSRSDRDQRVIEIKLTESGIRAITAIDQIVRQFDTDLEKVIGRGNVAFLAEELSKVLASDSF